jgi:predicted CXXCH cytochrome family protein
MQMPRFLHLLMTLASLTLWPALSFADLPMVPKAKEMANPETKCVEPIDVMRKNHMNFILHQRNDTLRLGMRTEKNKGHSLKECIECHNAPGADGKVARVSEREHFCNSCHSYVAVKIDCFDCHADKPVTAEYRHPTAGKKFQEQTSFDSKQLLNQEPSSSAATTKGKQP